MTMRPLLLATLALCAPLAACAGDNRGIETAHQPVVSRNDYALDLLAGPDGLAGGEAQRLRGWLDTLALGYGDTVAVDDPAGLVGARADVTAVVGSYGLSIADAAPTDAAALQPGTVRVLVRRTTAAVPSCAVPRARTALVNFDAHMSSDFGCAVNGNLAAMVADPADLVRGKADDGSGTAATGSKAIGAWRKAAPTGGGGTAVKAESTGGR
ncbi:MAG: pilus assembly protein CpaD [Sphingomonas taxi]|uniref:Pilus assembly protein CpaD n=1 Tax=Sphingomonas taxi TaxID=1549858 RepID=A0A2W5P2L8_9SPHN|nr:MAG: pilus assembly protein CpaD [Sphingomonas taxi]